MRIVYTGTSCCTGITIIPSNLSYVQRNSEIWSIHANPRETKSGEGGGGGPGLFFRRTQNGALGCISD